MAKYSLQSNEVVILKEESVAHGSFLAAYTSELILTNLNLVLVKKGILGNGKGILVFPIKQIKVYNGQAQALVGKKSNGRPALEVHLLNGEETFDFQSGGKKKILAWTAKINQVATGEEAPVERDSGRALPGAETVAGVLKDTVGVFSSRFGSKTNGPAKVARNCSACGAPVSGTQGLTISCEYCGTAQAL